MDAEPITQENTVWSVILKTRTGNHLAMGKGWSACLAAVKNFKCQANEDHQDIVIATWTISQIQPWPCQWTWNSQTDAPAKLPVWTNDYDTRVQAHS